LSEEHCANETIGPFDLALQMGVTRGGDEHEAAIQRVLKAARSAGKKAAIFCSNGQDAANRTQQGFDMVSVTTDVGVLAQGFGTELATARGGSAVPEPRQGY
jgi:4-hydroxy-2-oxoheptanedioate aldolase